MESLEDWGTYIYLGIPSMVMMCVEWWMYEIGSFLAGAYVVASTLGPVIVWDKVA